MGEISLSLSLSLSVVVFSNASENQHAATVFKYYIDLLWK